MAEFLINSAGMNILLCRTRYSPIHASDTGLAVRTRADLLLLLPRAEECLRVPANRSAEARSATLPASSSEEKRSGLTGLSSSLSVSGSTPRPVPSSPCVGETRRPVSESLPSSLRLWFASESRSKLEEKSSARLLGLELRIRRKDSRFTPPSFSSAPHTAASSNRLDLVPMLPTVNCVLGLSGVSFVYMVLVYTSAKLQSFSLSFLFSLA